MNKKWTSFTRVLNEVAPNYIRWCTPSVMLHFERIKDFYQSDTSISFEGLGFPFSPSGIFSDAYNRAAKAHRSDRTLFSVNGSTGSNFIILRTLAKQIPNIKILAQRNIHKSVLCACEDYGINLFFINPSIDPYIHIFLPNSIKEIIQHIEKVNPHVLLITNPTYEGLTINLKELIRKARIINPNLIIFIDEAWGAHLNFSDSLPDAAMLCGADICVQSGHKHGGSLQQTSMIHWREKRINSELLLESFRNLSTTSPSYMLLASLDAARAEMEKSGDKRITKMLRIAERLAEGLDKIHGCHVIKLSEIKSKSPAVFDKDNTKIILDISGSGYTGYVLAKILEEEHKIIVEKVTARTILFLVTFQSKLEYVNRTIKVLKEIFNTNKAERNKQDIPLLEIPQYTPKILRLGEVKKSHSEIVPLENAAGRISAENIIPYPPGIPTTIKGEEFTTQVIDFYKAFRTYPNFHAIANDIALKTVCVRQMRF